MSSLATAARAAPYGQSVLLQMLNQWPPPGHGSACRAQTSRWCARPKITVRSYIVVVCSSKMTPITSRRSSRITGAPAESWRAWHVEVNHWPLGFVPRETGHIATQEPGVEVECFVVGIYLVRHGKRKGIAVCSRPARPTARDRWPALGHDQASNQCDPERGQHRCGPFEVVDRAELIR